VADVLRLISEEPDALVPDTVAVWHATLRAWQQELA
jgi:hypothetical protein